MAKFMSSLRKGAPLTMATPQVHSGAAVMGMTPIPGAAPMVPGPVVKPPIKTSDAANKNGIPPNPWG